ncbi:hypothetical protein PUN28_013919 [Cardiocondyla obscurior]|uniref:Uncharacterized protein n=1 Tax=Cardiocondyla obscurior TaxID=286306 RepID=A0AAW2F8Z9_9HYME
MLTWTVVKFLEENSVEAIPTSWINNNKSIRKNQNPDINWPLYGVTIFRNSTYDNYILAREKAKKAENVSDLNSEISSNEENKKKV